MPAILDTNVLFARVSSRDQYHDRARDIIDGIDQGDLPRVVVTNYVVAEVLNLTREKLGPDPATDLLDRLLEGVNFESFHSPKTDFISAQTIFRRYPELSFVDATLVARMQTEDIEYIYSFDDGFDAVDDITRLDSAHNPFRE